MTSNQRSTEQKTLPSDRIDVLRTVTDHLVLVDTHDRTTTTVSLTANQAVIIHKLLTMPGDPLPEFHGASEFALAEDIPQERGESAGPFITVDEDQDTVIISTGTGEHVDLDRHDQTAFLSLLVEWGFTIDAEDRPGILTLPAMITLEDGISEPLLHADSDEVLEHYHRPVGYWSPNDGEYVTEH